MPRMLDDVYFEMHCGAEDTKHVRRGDSDVTFFDILRTDQGILEEQVNVDALQKLARNIRQDSANIGQRSACAREQDRGILQSLQQGPVLQGGLRP